MARRAKAGCDKDCHAQIITIKLHHSDGASPTTLSTLRLAWLKDKAAAACELKFIKQTTCTRFGASTRAGGAHPALHQGRRRSGAVLHRTTSQAASSRLMSTFTSPPKQAVLSWLQTHSHLSTVAIDGFWCCCVWSRPPGPHTLSAHPPPPLPP